jgi:inward rectifier potassium channel
MKEDHHEDLLEPGELPVESIPEKADGAELSLAEKESDLGFGTSISRSNTRLINPDGSFNVRKVATGIGAINPYLYLVSAPLWKFALIVVATYILFNSIFACFYLMAGIDGLTGAPEAGWGEQFAHAFYFSVQTFTTVGYGSISPERHTVAIIASFEAMFGLLAFALATGVVFGRFSVPQPRFVFPNTPSLPPTGAAMP